MKKIVLYIVCLVSSVNGFSQTSPNAFTTKFDAAAGLREAVEVLVDEAANSGASGISGITVLPTKATTLFGDGLRTWCLNAGANYQLARRSARIEKVELSSVKGEAETSSFIDALARHLSADSDLQKDLREYVKKSVADGVVAVSLIRPNGNVAIKWLLFFDLNSDKKWRLEQAVPQNFLPAPAGNFILKSANQRAQTSWTFQFAPREGIIALLIPLSRQQKTRRQATRFLLRPGRESNPRP